MALQGDQRQFPEPRVRGRDGQVKQEFRASVVVPTRNRYDLLEKCIEALARNRMVDDIEVIIVDDGSQPRVKSTMLPDGIAGTILYLDGGGPGAARNAGIAASRAPVVLFTDDDTIPCDEWVESAISYLEAHPECVGVNGPVRSPLWDPLFEFSIETDSPEHYFTCNIAYRREPLEKVGGFRSDVFRFAHAEDMDLAVRILAYGAVGYEQRMEILHTPRALTMRDVFRRARWTHDDLILHALHPQMASDFTLPVRLALVWGSAAPWLRLSKSKAGHFTLRRGVRVLTSFLVGMVTAGFTVIRTPSAKALRQRYADPLRRRHANVNGAGESKAGGMTSPVDSGVTWTNANDS